MSDNAGTIRICSPKWGQIIYLFEPDLHPLQLETSPANLSFFYFDAKLAGVATFFSPRAEIEPMPADKKKMSLEWKGNFRFEAKNPNGLTVNFDAPKKYGGEETAPSPMEALLACLAGCTSYDVVSILKKKRQNISGYWVEVEGERRDEPPEVYTKIQLKYIIKGKNISKEAVERAIQLSYEKYCSVGAMLRKTAEVTTSYEIIQE